MIDKDDLVRIIFPLEHDEDGYPPAETETLWARIVDDKRYEIDSIPFFVRGLSCGDGVSATIEDRQLRFQKVLTRGGHSTIRVIVYDVSLASVLRNRLAELGCQTECSHLPSLFAVDVPPRVDISLVIKELVDGERSDKWEYEEACIQHREGSE